MAVQAALADASALAPIPLTSREALCGLAELLAGMKGAPVEPGTLNLAEACARRLAQALCARYPALAPFLAASFAEVGATWEHRP